MCCCSDTIESKRSSRHSGEGFPYQDHLAVHDLQLLRMKDSPVSIDTSTHKTETSCEDISHESSPPAPPITDVTMETAQVETHSRSPNHVVHPRYSTPKQDIEHSGFQQSIQHNRTPPPPQVTPLGSIPEKTKGHISPSDCYHHHKPDFKSRSSPMLSGTRFCSEVSDPDHIQQH